ncbi:MULTISPECIES: hypothetical protein [unclassified Mycolicibacterium]|uniref:hypothetical protein n=1 Tax=unclassified Mycolicibacterium TaxID=2636767 RepID=UPI001EE4D8E5|nr:MULTISPECIES: hypothetical protein [unclassified Mycolicibacterium]
MRFIVEVRDNQRRRCDGSGSVFRSKCTHDPAHRRGSACEARARETGITENETVAVLCAGREMREWRRENAGSRQRLGKLHIGHTRRQPPDHIHAGWTVLQGDKPIRLMADSVHQTVLSVSTLHSSSTQVAGEMAVGEEVGQYSLIEDGSMSITQCSRGREHVDQRIGDHDITDLKRREENIVESAQMDDSVGRERCEWGLSATGVPVLAIRMILDDPRLVLDGPLNEFIPARRGHRVAERELVGGCHIREARLARAGNGCTHHEAVPVNRHRQDRRTRRLEDVTDAGVTGVLYEDSVAFIEEYTRAEVKTVLHPGNDDDLIRLAPESSRRGEVLGYRNAQWFEAARSLVTEPHIDP